MDIRNLVESYLLDEIAGIKYLGKDGNGLSFEINGAKYRYLPKDMNLDEWDSKVREVIGKYNKTGQALSYVKKTSSSYEKL